MPSATQRFASPARVELGDLIGLRAAGESIRLTAPRVRATAAGAHLAPFRGRGVEFDETRPYQPGDDLRTIDWRVTARTGKPHTKLFREERNRPVLVWLDQRSPMLFATRGVYKGVAAAATAALIAWSAIASGDRFGGLVFAEGRHEEFRPRLGRRAALGLFRLICDAALWEKAAPGGAADDVADQSLLRLVRVARPGSLMFLLSDFRGLGADLEQQLRQLASHADLFLILFYDPLEAELPPPGSYRIETGGRSMVIDTQAPPVRARYRAQFEARRDRLRAIARLPGIHLLECATTDDPRAVLARQFQSR